MNNEQILRAILEDEELKKYWSEENTDSLNAQTVGASKNQFLKLVKLHLIEKDDVISKKRLENMVNVIFDK